jgi:hypothetical protein
VPSAATAERSARRRSFSVAICRRGLKLISSSGHD